MACCVSVAGVVPLAVASLGAGRRPETASPAETPVFTGTPLEVVPDGETVDVRTVAEVQEEMLRQWSESPDRPASEGAFRADAAARFGLAEDCREVDDCVLDWRLAGPGSLAA
jgi:hypothetical protein